MVERLLRILTSLLGFKTVSLVKIIIGKIKNIISNLAKGPEFFSEIFAISSKLSENVVSNDKFTATPAAVEPFAMKGVTFRAHRPNFATKTRNP